jgi:signal transduction histidine kinase
VIDENQALRDLARQMAAVADSAALLDILCNAAAEQCDATGASVVKSNGDRGEVVASTGEVAALKGITFPLRGSLMREVAAARDVISVDDFSASARPLARQIPDLHIGPILAAPLLAHDALVGGVMVSRSQGAPPFTDSHRQRLRVIADHAALAVWKADLLEQAQSADRAKARFLATISHELRTPLTALTGYEELLADAVLGPLTPAQADVLERMRSVTHHLTAMIEEVLSYSSLEIGREIIRPSEFLAQDLVNAVMAVIEPLARQKRLTIVSELPDEPIRVTSDIDKVRQILVNLGGNAVKFTEKGEVRIVTSVDDAEIRFAVRDSGIGISATHADQIFQPFIQLDTSLTRRHGGTGLGLYISRRLAEALGGRIELKSELGKGSEFTLVLPLDGAASELPSLPAAPR